MTQPRDQAHSWGGGEGAFVRAHLALFEMPETTDDGDVPSRFRVLPWGEFETRDAALREMFLEEPGQFIVNERTAAEVPANFSNLDVGAFVNVDHNVYGEAYGWLTGVEVVEGDGVYIDVDWTDLGEQAVRNRRFRYSSGEVVFDASSWQLGEGPAEIVAVTGAALTNRPAVIGQAPVAFSSLTAALSASDGRKPGTQPQPPEASGEKGECRMDGNFWERLVSPILGRQPKDEVDAAKLAAEAQTIRENYAGALAERDEAVSKVAELTEQLAKANDELSELKAEAARRIEAEHEATIKAALKAGKIAPAQVEWAKANYDAFVSLSESVKEGTYTPPGRQVENGAADRVADLSLGSSDSEAEDAEIRAYMEAHEGLTYAKAALAVRKAKARAAAGKGV